jgi:hypothetical protein
MKPPYTIIIIFFICAIFFFLGFFGYTKFYQIVLPNIIGINYLMDLSQLEKNQTLFAFVFAAIPLLLFFTWELTPLHSLDKKTTSLFVVGICMVLATYIRYKILVNHFEEVLQSPTGRYSATTITYPFEEINYEYYLLGGILMGCIISYLLFHNVVKTRTVYFDNRIDKAKE